MARFGMGGREVGGKPRATNCDMATLFAITFGDKIRLGWCCWVCKKCNRDLVWDIWDWEEDPEPEHWHYKSTLLSWESDVELGGFSFSQRGMFRERSCPF